MDQPILTLSVLWTPLAVCRLGSGERVPAAAWDGEFCSMVREHGSVSLICDEAQMPETFFEAERDWRAIRIEQLDEMTDAEAKATTTRALTAAGVRSMALEDDVLLVKRAQLHDAMVALERAGFVVEL